MNTITKEQSIKAICDQYGKHADDIEITENSVFMSGGTCENGVTYEFLFGTETFGSFKAYANGGEIENDNRWEAKQTQYGIVVNTFLD